MNWLREITQTEYLYITAFLVFYLTYLIRMYFISKKIKINARRIALKFILRSAYFSLFIIALLGPSFGDIKKEIKTIGKDIYIAIDISASMNATDVNPSRIEKAKFEIAQALSHFNSDRIGLIIFSEEAFVQCPLTYDHEAIKLFLQTLNTKTVSLGGTDLNTPLAMAYSKLASSEQKTTNDEAKIIVLITDGENFSEQNPDYWLEKIKQADINLFILGIGSQEGSRIPMETGFKKDGSGHYVLSSLNSKELKKMSKLANGKYYEITPETNDMKTMIDKILKVEGTLQGSRKIESAANKYFYFLFTGIVLLLFDVLISFKTIRI
ncbi:MAG TPA: VWA domain-containing protein [Cytophagaceae bacterium]|nr:VWA domain-containing protein [Cytophagaceae bacterium]